MASYEEPPPPYPGTENTLGAQGGAEAGIPPRGAPPPYPGGPPPQATAYYPQNGPMGPSGMHPKPPSYDGTNTNPTQPQGYFGTFPATSAAVIVTNNTIGNCPRCSLANLEDTPDVGLIVCLVLMAFLFTPLTLCCIPCAFHSKCPNCGYSTG